MLRMDIPVFPDRRMFRVHDATVDPDAPGGPLAPMGALISVNREQIWVGSLQENVAVRVFLEEWDMARPRLGAEGAGGARAVFSLRGAVTSDWGPAGRAGSGPRRAGGGGASVARVSAPNRREVYQLYNELFERGVDPLSDEFQQARKNLEGHEQYLLQLWREP